MNMKQFATYLKNTSFDEELHKIRQISLERIVANEPVISERQSSRPSSKTTPIRKTA